MDNLLSDKIQHLGTSARKLEHRLRQFDEAIIIDQYCYVRKRKLEKLWTKLTEITGSKLRQIEKKVMDQNNKADKKNCQNGSIRKLLGTKLDKLQRKLQKLDQKVDKVTVIHQHENKAVTPVENGQNNVPEEIRTLYSQLRKFEQQLQKTSELDGGKTSENLLKKKLEKLGTKLREIIGAKLPYLERKASLWIENKTENGEDNVVEHKCSNPSRLEAKLEKLRKRLQKLQQKLYKVADTYGPIKFSDCLDIANNASCHALMNCLLREYALPAELARYEWPENMSGIKISLKTKTIVLPLTFTLNNVAFFVVVDRICQLGSHRYFSNIFCRHLNTMENCEKWISANSIETFAEFAIDAICGQNPRTNEANQLLTQIVLSRNAIKEILECKILQNESPYHNFLASEQGLVFGHYSHPAPKTRLSPLTGSTIADFWPETRTPIRMHLIEVPKTGLWIGRTDDYLTEEDILRGLSDQSIARPGYAILALHPLQVQLMSRDPRMQRLIRDGIIRNIGPYGLLVHPTSSVRSLYIDGHPFQLKSALGIRITNCTRINPQKVLEGVIIIEQMISHIEINFPEVFEGIQLVRETAAVSWAPNTSANNDATQTDLDWFRSNTGTILRENFCLFDSEESKIILTATLFAVDITGQKSNILEYLQSLHPQATKVEFNQIIEEWFRRYAILLTRPVMKALLQHGLAMEPHLQNVLVKVNNSNGYPEKVLVRDKEDFRFVHGSAILDKAWPIMSEQSRQFIPCTSDYAWTRIVYCLFVNNISSSVLALTFDRPELAKQLWEILRGTLVDLCEELTVANCDVNSLKALIDGGRFFCKANMKLRLSNASDRSAEYQFLGSPWAPSKQSSIPLCCFPYSPVCPVYPN